MPDRMSDAFGKLPACVGSKCEVVELLTRYKAKLLKRSAAADDITEYTERAIELFRRIYLEKRIEK